MRTEQWAVKIKDRGAFTTEVYAVDGKSGHDLRCVGIAVAADASLIAAAPDLLAACEAVAADEHGHLTDVVALVRAAITKAKGGK